MNDHSNPAVQEARPEFAREQLVAVLGGGVMGETILTSVLKAGWDGDHVLLSERHRGRATELAQRHAVTKSRDNIAAATVADVIVIAVKPQDVGALLDEISPSVRSGVLVMSVAVGLPTSFYEERLPEGTPVVRVMPNTPAVIGAGVSAISAGAAALDEHLALVEEMLAATGTVLRFAEKDQDAVAAISGSGPAYIFYVIDALAEAGVMLGLGRYQSRQLAARTVLGAAQLCVETDEHPVILRERVSSPAGTTIAGLRELDDRGVRAAFLAAAEAARDRSVKLGNEL